MTKEEDLETIVDRLINTTYVRTLFADTMFTKCNNEESSIVLQKAYSEAIIRLQSVEY